MQFGITFYYHLMFILVKIGQISVVTEKKSSRMVFYEFNFQVWIQLRRTCSNSFNINRYTMLWVHSLNSLRCGWSNAWKLNWMWWFMFFHSSARRKSITISIEFDGWSNFIMFFQQIASLMNDSEKLIGMLVGTVVWFDGLINNMKWQRIIIFYACFFIRFVWIVSNIKA